AVLRLGGDLQFGWQAGALDDQTVIARRLEWGGQPAQHALPAVVDARGLAVNRLARPHHTPAEDLADALVPQADAQCRDARAKPGDQRAGDARFARRAGTGRD